MSVTERTPNPLQEACVAFPGYIVGTVKTHSIHVWMSFDNSLPESPASYNLPQATHVRMIWRTELAPKGWR